MYSIHFLWVVFLLVMILSISLIYMALRLLYYKNSERKKVEWKKLIQPLIQRCLTLDKVEANESHFILSQRKKKKLKNPFFRNYLMECLVEAKQTNRAKYPDNISLLYVRLNLHEDSLKKLYSQDWTVIVEGIRELAIMDQRMHVFRILHLVGNKNEFVRMEAQSAILRFYKSKGLCFLTLDANDLCQWQQIRLSQQILKENIENIYYLEELLQASNASIIVFALKLIRRKRLIELSNSVSLCLHHLNSQVRIESRKCLKELQYSLQTTTSQKKSSIKMQPQLDGEDNFHSMAGT